MPTRLNKMCQRMTAREIAASQGRPSDRRTLQEISDSYFDSGTAVTDDPKVFDTNSALYLQNKLHYEDLMGSTQNIHIDKHSACGTPTTWKIDGFFMAPTATRLRGAALDDTLVLWTTEFGRMPTHQAGTTGRDHNPDGFTCWMMGAGVRGGTRYGATDEFGRKSVDKPVTVWDFYATALRLLGFDHKRLTWYYNGLDRRLTDVQGQVIEEILA